MGPRQGLLPEARHWRQGIAVEREQVQLVLALERHVDPWLARVKIEVPRSKAVAAIRRHGDGVGEPSVTEVEDLERARVFGLFAGT